MEKIEDKKQIKKKYNKEYVKTENGKKALRRACLKYQRSEKYKEYKRQYYLKKKEEKMQKI